MGDVASRARKVCAGRLAEHCWCVRFDKSHLAAGTRQEGEGQIVALSGVFILMGAIFKTQRSPTMTISKERATPARVGRVTGRKSCRLRRPPLGINIRGRELGEHFSAKLFATAAKSFWLKVASRSARPLTVISSTISSAGSDRSGRHRDLICTASPILI